jgi:hypothetical protein
VIEKCKEEYKKVEGSEEFTDDEKYIFKLKFMFLVR